MTRKSGQFYEVNRAFTLVGKLTGRGYSTATKITSDKCAEFRQTSFRKILEKNLYTLLLTSFAEQQATQSMNKASIEAKEYLYRNGQIEVLSGTGLPGEIPQIDVSGDV